MFPWIRPVALGRNNGDMPRIQGQLPGIIALISPVHDQGCRALDLPERKPPPSRRSVMHIGDKAKLMAVLSLAATR